MNITSIIGRLAKAFVCGLSPLCFFCFFSFYLIMRESPQHLAAQFNLMLKLKMVQSLTLDEISGFPIQICIKKLYHPLFIIWIEISSSNIDTRFFGRKKKLRHQDKIYYVYILPWFWLWIDYKCILYFLYKVSTLQTQNQLSCCPTFCRL